jgi:hypothetical protein
MENLPGFGSGFADFSFDPAGVTSEYVARVRRTYEPHRLVELAAIAVAGVGLYHGGGHEIMEVAARGYCG